MSTHISFDEDYTAIHINWYLYKPLDKLANNYEESPEDSEGNEEYDLEEFGTPEKGKQINLFVRKLKELVKDAKWKYDGKASFSPISIIGSINDWVYDLKKIIIFLNDNNIPWIGCNFRFFTDKYGLLLIKKEIAIIVTTDTEGDSTKEIIPICNPYKKI